MNRNRYNPAPRRRRLSGGLLRATPLPRTVRAALWYGVCVLSLFSAPSAFGQGIEIKTWNGATDTPRFRIESGAATEEAYFLGVKLGVGTNTPDYPLDVEGTGTIGIRYLKTGTRDARIQVGDPTQTWGLAAGWATAGDFSLIEEGTSGNRFYVQRTTGYVGLGTSTPGARLEVTGSGTGLWVGWNEAIRLRPDAHAAITHPGAGLLFGLHGNRNFYWADTTNGWYSMILDPTGELTVRDKLLINGTDNAWGNTVINGRVWSTNANLHLSPPAGFDVIINDSYREAGGAGGGSAGLIVEGVAQCNAGLDVDDQMVIDNGGGWHRTYGNTGWYNGTHGGGWYMTDATYIRTYGGKNVLISSGQWAGLYFENTAGRSVTLENNNGLAGGGGARYWDQSGAGQIVDMRSDKTISITRIKSEAGTSTVRLREDSNAVNICFDWFGGPPLQFQCYRNAALQKTFVIDHPVDPDRHLIHATLEGPENAVFYRGTARLKDGRAEIVLPSYFEALTREEGRTVQLSPKFRSLEEPVSNLAYSRIRDGRFQVAAVDGRNPGQAFSWEVKAARKDVPPPTVEPDRDEVEVRGFGPYRWYDRKRGAGREISLYPGE